MCKGGGIGLSKGSVKSAVLPSSCPSFITSIVEVGVGVGVGVKIRVGVGVGVGVGKN